MTAWVQNWGRNSCEDQVVEVRKPVWSSLFFLCVFSSPSLCTVFIPTFHFILSFGKTGTHYPQFGGTLQITLLVPNIEPYKIDLRELWEQLEWIARRTIAIILLWTPQNMAPIGAKKRKEKEKKCGKQWYVRKCGEFLGTTLWKNLWRIFGDKIMEELIVKLMENSWANIIGKSLLGTIPLDNSKAGKTFLKSLSHL